MIKKTKELSKGQQEIAELYGRLERVNNKVKAGAPVTRHMSETVQGCMKRMDELFEEVGAARGGRIPVEDTRILVEYFSGIRFLPEFEKNPSKGARLFKSMQVIFGFDVTVETLATYYYSTDKMWTVIVKKR